MVWFQNTKDVSLLTFIIPRDTKREQVAAAMAARQKKREDNIALRNERRKEKQKKKARPGFEGKSFGKRNQNLKKSCSKGKH